MPRGTLTRSQVVHINSANRVTGTIQDFTVAFAPNLLRADGAGYLVLEPVQAVVNRSWYTVDETNQLFQIFDGDTLTDYVIPKGFYNLKSFLLAISLLLPDWAIGWDPIVSHYVYTPPDDGKTYKLLCPTWLCSLLGFSLGSEHECSHSEPLRSDFPVKMTHESVLIVHCDVPKARGTAVDNLLTMEMNESTTLIKVPITAAPFDNLVWRANAPGIVSYELNTTNVTQMRFWVTDEFDRPLKLAYDWTMSLRFDHYTDVSDSSQMARSLARMSDYLRYLILSEKRNPLTQGKTAAAQPSTSRRR